MRTMKKLLVVVVFTFSISAVFGQRFEGGLLGGFNASQVKGDLYNGYHKPGVLVGGYVRTDIAPAVFVAMELKYSQKGSRKKYDPKKPEESIYIMRLGYIDMPVLAGFRTSDKISVIAGTSIGYMIHGTEYDNYGKFVVEDQNAFNDFDLQAFGGFQFDLLDNLKLDLRMAYSLLPIRGLPGANATNYYWLNNQFNNVLSLAIYYRLDR